MISTFFASFISVLVLTMSSSVVAREQPLTLTERLTAASKHKRYEPVGQAELRRAESIFLKTLKSSESFPQLRQMWNELGWDFERLEKGEKGEKATDVLFILSESSGDLRGRGFFAFRSYRVGETLPVALQAPHSFFDKHTRRITLRLFEDGPVAAAAWNIIRRSVVDAAHSRDSYINAFTRAFLQVGSPHAIVQLHGFAQDKRKTAEGRTSNVIVSNGTRLPGRLARHLTTDLTAALDDTVRLYPSQVEELGGTKNTQAGIVHRHGYDSFVHVELSAEIRQSLRNQDVLRNQFRTQFFSSLSIFLSDTK